MATLRAPTTIADIDVQITQAQWRWRHALWEGNEYGIVAARARQDELLDQRLTLTLAGGHREPSTPDPAAM